MFAKRLSNTGKTRHIYPVIYHNRLYIQMQHKSGAVLIWRDNILLYQFFWIGLK